VKIRKKKLKNREEKKEEPGENQLETRVIIAWVLCKTKRNLSHIRNEIGFVWLYKVRDIESIDLVVGGKILRENQNLDIIYMMTLDIEAPDIWHYKK